MRDVDRERRIFDQTVDLSGAARDSRLVELCDGDDGLADRLRRLLAAHDAAEGVSAFPPRVTRREDDDPRGIGPYRILERIGEGGMGVVFLAEQTQPLRRRVAIKIIKVGMDTKEVIARFDTERQALARMNHPNIARILEAGATERGRPYFVMEYVPGVSLIEYCRTRRLGVKERLRLFVQVASAVQHAHQKGVIHRDLKPTNLLVAEEDGVPMPKVIDFGVAKATHQKLSKHTLHTGMGSMIGTPEYMSPEQAEMGALEVDTRSDVYSLGVVLYELLTGVQPFRSEDLRAAGFAEIQRIVREVDPPRPSARLAEREREGRTDESGAGIAARHLRGELDWIVMRAIDKERSRRYDSASALYKDVERYLADLPVRAGPPSAAYALRKFVKRHRYTTFVVVAGLIAAGAGVAGLTVGLIDAREARLLADRRADNALVATDFLQRALFHVDPEFGGGDLSMLELLDLTARAIDRDLGRHPEVEASVRESIGVAYRRLSMFEKAEPHLRRSLEIRRALFGDVHLQTSRSLIAMAYLAFEQQGSIDEPLRFLHLALAGIEANGLADTPVEGWVLLDIGLISLGGDRLPDAERAFQKCEELLAERSGADHPDLSRPLRGLAMIEVRRGNPARGEELAREAVRLCEGEGTEYIGARAKVVLARVLIETGGFDEADRLLTEARAQFARTVGPRHVRMAELDACRCELEIRRGDLAAAEAAAERCDSVRREVLHPDHWARLEGKLLRERARVGLGQVEAAEAELLPLSEDAARLVGDDHPVSIAIAEARLDCAKALEDESLATTRAERLARMRDRRAERLREQSAS
jgi:non-specific serine/threonine protein kinase/serine/threonine-protein kinase